MEAQSYIFRRYKKDAIMIVTVFGDVHGNLVALEQFLKIEQSQTDLFVSHGDIVNYGPWTNECISLVKELNNCILLKGNHEHYFIDGKYDGQNDVAKAFFDFCYTKFDKNYIIDLFNYKEQLILSNFTIQHTIGQQYIFQDTNIDSIHLVSDYIIGHSHQQYERQKDNFKIYNTGSIGQNRSLLNLSCYLKIDTEKKTVELKNFIHDVDKVINKMKVEKYPTLCLDYYKSKKRV